MTQCYFLIYTVSSNLFIARSAKTALLWLFDNRTPQEEIIELYGENYEAVLRKWDEQTVRENLDNIENWFDVYIEDVEGEE